VGGRGPALIVRCMSPSCSHAAIVDPRRVFTSRKDWPAEGASTRFRCVCGSRQADVALTRRSDWQEGPANREVLALWY
jgi:hypothetical protein